MCASFTTSKNKSLKQSKGKLDFTSPSVPATLSRTCLSPPTPRPGTRPVSHCCPGASLTFTRRRRAPLPPHARAGYSKEGRRKPGGPDPLGPSGRQREGSHLHSLLAQADAAGQALARAHVGVLVLHEERLQCLQLLFAEDGAVTPRAPLRARAAGAGQRPGASRRHGQGQGCRGSQSKRPRQPRACGARAR